ncbi:hypothetical protein T439DRAFT_286401 [Meredithblackwellia eburnea MCA 4105]
MQAASAATRAQVDNGIKSRRHSDSAQSEASTSSDSPIDYSDFSSSSSASSSRSPSPTSPRSHNPRNPTPAPTGEGITTRKGKDYRPVSTFYLKPWKEMTHYERVCDLATCPESMHKVKDEGLNRGPVPRQSVLRENAFILSRGLIPILIQSASYWAFPNFKWPTGLAYTFYFFSFMGFALAVSNYCVKLGTFDEKKIGRDRTPDQSVNGLAKGIIIYMFFRTGLAFYLHYNKEENPLMTFTWTFPLKIAAWELALDYFFYVYHRSSHEIDALWFIHQHHHTTKHPTAILAILAEDKQECLEIALIPTLASLLVPMSFAELYLTMAYTIYVEMLGHSGVRAYWPHPVLWVLKVIDCELAVEDHELHHRFGKSGKNYGKQSRLWDRLFGTVGERIETYGM